MRILSGLLALTFTLTACGGNDSGGSEAELRSAAEDYFAAFFEPDAEAGYAMLSDRCRGMYDQDKYAELLDLASSLYGDVEVKINDVDVDGDEGTVDGETGVPALDEDNDDGPQWVYEDGEWKSDACD